MSSVKQMTVRMTKEEWKRIKNYLTEKDATFSDVVLEVLSREIALTKKGE